jgi:hypothetical protein
MNKIDSGFLSNHPFSRSAEVGYLNGVERNPEKPNFNSSPMKTKGRATVHKEPSYPSPFIHSGQVLHLTFSGRTLSQHRYTGISLTSTDWTNKTRLRLAELRHIYICSHVKTTVHQKIECTNAADIQAETAELGSLLACVYRFVCATAASLAWCYLLNAARCVIDSRAEAVFHLQVKFMQGVPRVRFYGDKAESRPNRVPVRRA